MNRLAYNSPTRRSVHRIRSSFVIRHSSLSTRGWRADDSASLSEIVATEKRRARILAISILFLLIAAACIYLAQS